MNIKRIVVGLYRENCYLLTKDKDLIIVDPGDEFDKLNKIIINNDYNLKAILITHAHFDHIGALQELISNYKVPIYYHNVNNEIEYNNLIDIDEKEYTVGNFIFKVIYVPGHRNDSVVFYFEEENSMFVGDFIFKNSIGRTDLEYADSKQMQISLEKIKQYDDNIILYPGHDIETTLKDEKENNFYFN